MTLMTPNDVRTVELTVRRFAPGYDTDETDDLLDSIADSLHVLGTANRQLGKRIEHLERLCRMHGINTNDKDHQDLQGDQNVQAD